jgi:hypothetical protein
MNFNTMSAGELSAELECYQLQIRRQQDNGQPMTPAQKRRFVALRNAYRRACDDLAR